MKGFLSLLLVGVLVAEIVWIVHAFLGLGVGERMLSLSGLLVAGAIYGFFSDPLRARKSQTLLTAGRAICYCRRGQPKEFPGHREQDV